MIIYMGDEKENNDFKEENPDEVFAVTKMQGTLALKINECYTHINHLNVKDNPLRGYNKKR